MEAETLIHGEMSLDTVEKLMKNFRSRFRRKNENDVSIGGAQVRFPVRSEVIQNEDTLHARDVCRRLRCTDYSSTATQAAQVARRRHAGVAGGYEGSRARRGLAGEG